MLEICFLFSVILNFLSLALILPSEEDISIMYTDSNRLVSAKSFKYCIVDDFRTESHTSYHISLKTL